MRRNGRARWQGIERGLIGLRGIARIAGLLEIIGLLQQCREMPRLEREGLFDGVELLETPAERLQTAGKIGPDRGLIGICSGRAAEQKLRLIGGAARQHAHPQLVEHGRVVRRALRHIGQQAVGFRHAAGGLLRLGSLQCTNDRRFIERRRSSRIHGIIV